jgi:hypothetical protein
MGRRRIVFMLGSVGVVVAVMAALVGSLMAVLGAELPCSGGSGGTLGAPPTRAAANEIPLARLPIYRAAAKRYRVNWAFLASVGTQECSTGTCAHVYSSGCGGPMQIAIERESACSPGSGPTIWERYGVDADGDGEANPFSLADAIFTAARMLRPVFGLAGDSFAAYRETACNYYGACEDASASYAAEVMARAVRYGFNGAHTPAGEDEPAAVPVSGGSCGGGQLPSGSGPMGPVHKAFEPRHLAPLPAVAGAGEECDARIVPDVVYLARRFGLIVTDCYGTGHAADGEHPLGAAIDVAPKDGDWNRTMRAALAAGWRPSCAVSGVAPACAKPPFRFVGYNGYENHGDPLHCVPCTGGPHLHISWLTSASSGQAENRTRYAYEPARWIEVFATGSEDGEDGGEGGGAELTSNPAGGRKGGK